MNSNSEPIKQLIDILQQTIKRYDFQRTSPTPSGSLASLGDALNWVYILDNHSNEIFGKSYWTFREQDALGKVVIGLRYARGLLAHNHLATDLVDVANGAHFPVRYPVTLFDLKWKALKVLPRPRKLNPSQQKLYATCVAEKLVRETLREALTFFKKVIECL